MCEQRVGGELFCIQPPGATEEIHDKSQTLNIIITFEPNSKATFCSFSLILSSYQCCCPFTCNKHNYLWPYRGFTERSRMLGASFLIITNVAVKDHKTCDEPSSIGCICFNGFSAPPHSGYTTPALKKTPYGFNKTGFLTQPSAKEGTDCLF